MDILVQLISGMRGLLQYVIIIDPKWTMYTFVDLILKERMTYIIYKPPSYC